MDEDIFMSKQSVYKFEIISDFMSNTLTRKEAAEQLDVNVL